MHFSAFFPLIQLLGVPTWDTMTSFDQMSADSFITIITAVLFLIMSLIWLFEAYERLKSDDEDVKQKGRRWLRESRQLFLNALLVSVLGLYAIPLYVAWFIFIIIRTIVRANRLAKPQ